MNSAYQAKFRHQLQEAAAFAEVASGDTHSFYAVSRAQASIKAVLTGKLEQAAQMAELKNALSHMIAAESLDAKPFAARRARICLEEALKPHCGRQTHEACGLKLRSRCGIHADAPPPQARMQPTTREFVSPTEFLRQVRAGLPTDFVKKDFEASPQQSPLTLSDRLVRFCFSTGDVDRSGDRIEQTGWSLRAFQDNPVCLFNHNPEKPIGKASRVFVSGSAPRLMGDIEFMGPDLSKLADAVFRMVKGGFLRATSVGFVPLEWEPIPRSDGIHFKKCELLEISVVAVPANSGALLAEARRLKLSAEDLDRLIEK